ncbi:MAG: M67 family metallopeptidase [Caldilineaceae bacterium]|nr:M67 family metallopeptidase [Caldilineaceae bacterium]HRJ45683.1 M67 family metallopeptidase [Caldilineaceae bacterium]
MQAITLPQTIYDEIIAHALEGKPEEICGILRGRGTEAFELFRAKNIAPERIENYDVDPQTLMKQFAFEEAGDEMMGIYHSHPVSVAWPSATDAWNAHYPDTFYLICSTEYDDGPILRAFRMVASYPEVNGDALRQALPFREVRQGLFGYYQAADRSTPRVLHPVAADVALPFYVVFTVDDAGAVDELRFVEVTEYRVEIGE